MNIVQPKKVLAAIIATTLGAFTGTAHEQCSLPNDSVEIFAYSQADGAGGMKFAIKCCNSGKWNPFADSRTILSSDFGSWGPGKRMFFPVIAYDDANGMWGVTFNPDKAKTVLAYTTSPNLTNWVPQEYSATANPRTLPSSFRMGTPATETVGDNTYSGSILKVPAAPLRNYLTSMKAGDRKWGKHSQTTADDNERFKDLEPLNLSVRLQPHHSKPISDKLMGIFFEDINYAADGGLYGELVQNRDFEYGPADHSRDNWDSMYAWSFKGNGTYKSTIETENPIHANNAHYLSLDIIKPGIALYNTGYDGIPVKKGENYNFSIKANATTGNTIEVSLVTPAGKTIATKNIKIAAGDAWQNAESVLTAKESCDSATLRILPKKKGAINLDMISLFPENTFKHRKNGLRADLAQTLADLKPQFVRFPGGCVAHGNGIDNIYDWKGSIGDLEARKGMGNLWGYHQTRGLGYYEYFLFCEDINAEPLPVLAAGVPCQNSAWKAHHSCDVFTSEGQQGGIPMEEMDAYVQDILDLIEYANGDVNTRWGAERAKAGHPEPFNLKYIGIGNEDLITDAFKERFLMIYNAIKKAYPEMIVVGTVGPFYEGPDYEEGWRFAVENNIPIVDEHYYVSPGWLIHNQDYYDKYRRGGTKVYLGEYASHMDGRPSNLEVALSDALYLTSVERNADVVEMSSYAPLLAKKNHTQWRPDLIYFDNTDINLTPDYYVQRMYGQNSGTTYVPAISNLDSDNEEVKVRVGTSTVIDPETGDLIVKLVNMLPVEVNTNLQSTENLKSGKVNFTLLTGTPGSTQVEPVEGAIDFTGTYVMPPYSFTVLRFPNN